MIRRVLSTGLVVITTMGLTTLFQPLASPTVGAQAGCQTFRETGKSVCGKFLQYWQKNGGLAQQGFPISNEFTEVSELDGKTYTVQYFERAVFELHPENNPPYDVLLSQLGTFQFKRKYPNGEPGGQPQPTPPAQGNDIVGQTIEYRGLFGVGRLKATVTDAREVNSLTGPPWIGTVSAKGKYVVVFATISNIGSEPASSYAALRLRDGKGREFDMAPIEATIAAGEQYKVTNATQSIQPGMADKYVMVFDMATDATGYRLVDR